MKVAQSCLTLCNPKDCIGHGILQARILEWVAFSFSRVSSQTRYPALQEDSLPAEPQGKPKNTGVGSLSLLQQIFPTQGLNQGLLHCRWILYQLSSQGSLVHKVRQHCIYEEKSWSSHLSHRNNEPTPWDVSWNKDFMSGWCSAELWLCTAHFGVPSQTGHVMGTLPISQPWLLGQWVQGTQVSRFVARGYWLEKQLQPKSWELCFIQWEFWGLQVKETASQVNLRELLWGGERSSQIA